MKFNTGLLVVLSFALHASSAQAEIEVPTGSPSPASSPAPILESCEDLRQKLGVEYIEKSAVAFTETALLKKLYATAEAPLTRVKQLLKPEFFGEIEKARIEKRLVDGRFADLVAKVAKSTCRAEACAKSHQVRIGDEHDFSMFNDLIYCARKDNEYSSYLPSQNNLRFTQGRVAVDASSALGMARLVQDDCPGREDCFLKVRSFAVGKSVTGEPRDLELNLDLASADLAIRPTLDKLVRRLDPAGVLNRTHEEYVTSMLRDTLGRADCFKSETYEAKE